MKVVALAGGVGGAKLADGLQSVLPPGDLTVIVNTGDDFEHMGLTVCPDLDTVCYNLAGLYNPETGWGRRDESWRVFQTVEQLGGPTWFALGDLDLATHLERTRRLRAGETLTEITAEFCRRWGISATVLPMSDQPVPTKVLTEDGEMAFQEYFVANRCEPKVTGFHFENILQATPAPGVLESIAAAEVVVICPSNPWVSIDPILGVPGIRAALSEKIVVAVSPIIGGKALKGPAAKMYTELEIEPSALAVLRHFGALLSGFVIDNADEILTKHIGIPNLITGTIMVEREQRSTLAEEVLSFAREL
ncbi:2-phospho-L-lactate transferase [bacterium]|nr:2-phospho-L-lactate transferase [bacterium]MCB2179392.1 2-phospho-L-lactate transferase [bacterium]